MRRPSGNPWLVGPRPTMENFYLDLSLKAYVLHSDWCITVDLLTNPIIVNYSVKVDNNLVHIWPLKILPKLSIFYACFGLPSLMFSRSCE